MVGHSNGGGEVLIAAATLDPSLLPRLAAVATIGPNAEMASAAAGYAFGNGAYPQVVITGSYDYALGDNQALEAIARAERPWSLGWLMRANHNGFNTVWAALAEPDGMQWSPDTVSTAAHEAFARALVVSLVRSELLGHGEQAAYWRGEAQPRSLRGIDGRIWYEGRTKRTAAKAARFGRSFVIDDFAVDRKGALSPGVNATGGEVTLAGERVFRTAHYDRSDGTAWASFKTSTGSADLVETGLNASRPRIP